MNAVGAQRPRKRNRVRTAMAWSTTVLLALVGGWWAGRNAFTPPDPQTSGPGPITVSAEEGTVSEVVTLTARAQWPASATFPGGRDGTITTIDFEPGDAVDAGQQVLSVDLRPVIVAEGAVPAFRDLSEGATGEDVAQLERLLVARGGAGLVPDATFDSATKRALSSWQEANGFPPTGTMPLGDILFLPALPSPLSLPPEVDVGTRISAGEPMLSMPQELPDVVVTVPPELVGELPSGTRVSLNLGSTVLDAETAALELDPETTQTVARLTGPGGGRLCTADCRELVPFGQTRTLAADLTLVPPTTGTVVPAAAITTTPDGRTQVTIATGGVRSVQVLASADGRSVVEGIEPDDQVVMTFAATDD